MILRDARFPTESLLIEEAQRGRQAFMMKKSGSVKAKPATSQSASTLIDGRIEELGDWRGEMLARLRALIRQADPEVVE